LIRRNSQVSAAGTAADAGKSLQKLGAASEADTMALQLLRFRGNLEPKGGRVTQELGNPVNDQSKLL
jgi:hypothetical protein